MLIYLSHFEILIAEMSLKCRNVDVDGVTLKCLSRRFAKHSMKIEIYEKLKFA